MKRLNPKTGKAFKAGDFREDGMVFSAYNKQVFDYCEKHRINPIISELRHSYFWDGGVSCCTQDIRRKGGLETYL